MTPILRRMTVGRTGRGLRLVRTLLLAGTALSHATGASAQAVVFLDDAPAAGETIRTLPALLDAGEISEAAREMQRLFDLDTGRVLATTDAAGVHRSVREIALRTLLGSPELLERYRENESRRAETLLAEGRLTEVERSRWATRSGFAASLSLAASSFESGAFDAAGVALRELLDHPDSTEPALAGAAAGLAAQLASYHPSLAPLARRWAERADRPLGDIAPVDLPPRAIARVTDALRGGNSALTEPFDAQPMWSTEIGITPVRRRAAEGLATRSYPAISDELLVVNAAEIVRAWDRFTLQPRWTYSPGEDVNRLALGEDPYSATPTPAGFLVELPSRGGGVRIALLDRQTGEPLWSRLTAEMGPGLNDVEIVGPPVLAGDVVVVVMDATERLRRLRSAVVVGLDAATGEVVWRRLIASAGSERNNNDIPPPQVAAIDDGIVYSVSSMGVLSAVEAHSGRLRWVRDITEDTQLNPVLRTRGDQQANLVIADDRLVMVAPDRRSVLAFDTQTGAEVERLNITGSSAPKYLHLWDDTLLMVARDQVVAVDANALNGPWVRVVTYPSQSLAARSMLAGDQLVIPMPGGLMLVDLKSQEVEQRLLDAPGSIVVDSGQAITIDDEQVHSYLAWPVAERELLARMDARPNAADPAITYIRLALRAERYTRVLEIVDRAIAALDAKPSVADRLDLFATIRSVLEPAIEGDTLPRPEGELRASLVERLDAVAATPDQRVAQRVLASRVANESDRPRDAVEALQDILSDADLARSQWDDGRVRVNASAKATQELRSLLGEHGVSIYTNYAGRAARELDRVSDDASAEAFESIARMYPVAPAAARAWLRAADVYAAADDHAGEIVALENGVAMFLTENSGSIAQSSRDVSSELSGRLIEALELSGRYFAAATTLQRVIDAPADLVPSINGEPIDLAARLSALRDLLVGGERFPRIAPSVGEPVQVIAGWGLVEPLLHEGTPPPTGHVMLRSETASLIALFASDAGESGDLRAVWARPTTGADPVLLSLNPVAAYLLWTEPTGISVERVDTVTGKTVWKSEPLWDVLGAQPPARVLGGIIETPLDGAVTRGSVLASMSDDTLHLVQRDGQIVAIDLDSGETLWTRTESDRVVYEIDAESGVLAIAGARVIPAAGAIIPKVLVLDGRTGEQRTDFEPGRTALRWVRILPQGQIAIGTDSAVSLHAADGQLVWANRDPGVQLSADAWTLLDQVVVMGPDRRIRMLDPITGEIEKPIADDRGRVGSASQIRAWTQAERAIFATDRGLAVFASDGRLVGIDAINARDELVLPAVGDGLVAILTRPRARNQQREFIAELWFVSSASGRLISRQPLALGALPDSLMLLDGRVLISAGGVTLAYDAEPAITRDDGSTRDEAANDADSGSSDTTEIEPTEVEPSDL